MTTAQSGYSSSFISPTRLQAMRQQERQNNFKSEDQIPSTSRISNSPASPAPNPSPPRHQRNSSFFNFKSHKSEPKRQPSLIEKTRSRDSEYTPPSQPPNSAPTTSNTPAPVPSLHPEIKSIVSLAGFHAHKIYFSGPLVRKIELGPDGQKPVKEEEWTDVWAQLGGTTLSVWNMKEVKLASEQGREVPPSYINITDAFISVIGTITTKPTPSQSSRRFPDVFTVNTAGANMILFSCPNPSALMSWAAAIRLSAWEKSRLEEMYTAHLIRISLNARDAPSSLVRGRLEGWARIRVTGHTDWKRVYMVLSSSGPSPSHQHNDPISNTRPVSPTRHKNRNRMSALFSRSSSPSSPRLSSDSATASVPQIQFLTGPKPKDRKKPLLVITDLSQAFAVYPERPELISRSTLIKVEGKLGDEDGFNGPQGHGAGAGAGGQSMKGREGWVLIMPEIPEPTHGHPPVTGSVEMLRWIVALHDAFSLYGRPQAWSWDPRDPVGLMFAYPVGSGKEQLFLPLGATEGLNPRDEVTSLVRGTFTNIVLDRMRAGLHGPSGVNGPGSSPLHQGSIEPPQQPSELGAGASQPQGKNFQLPPLSFNTNQDHPVHHSGALTPITERSNSVVTSGTRDFAPSKRESSFAVEAPLRESPEELEKKEEYFTPNHTPSASANDNALEQRGPVTQRGDSIPAPFNSYSAPQTNHTNHAPTEEEEKRHHLGEGALIYLQHQQQQDTGGQSPERSSTASITHGGPMANPHDRASPRLMTASPLGSPHLGPAPAGSPGIGSSSNSINSLRMQHPNSDHSTPTPTETHVSGLNIHKIHPPIDQHSSPPPSSGSMGWPTTASPSTLSPGSVYSPSTLNEPQRQSSYGFSAALQNDQNSAPTVSLVRQEAPAALGQNANLAPNPVQPSLRTPSPAAVGRKPSGARAPSAGSKFASSSISLTTAPFVPPPSQPPQTNSSSVSASSHGGDTEELSSLDVATHESEADFEKLPPRLAQQHSLQSLQMQGQMQHQGFAAPPRPSPPDDDESLDALAALSYLNVSDPPPEPVSAKTLTDDAQFGAQQLATPKTTQSPPPAFSSSPHGQSDVYKSSFAPNKRAAEREAKVRAQAAAKQKPGRTNGRQLKAPADNTWGESSDEEEDEEEDSDDDDEPIDRRATSSQGHNPHSREATTTPVLSASQLSHLRPPRSLPQVPPGQFDEGDMDDLAARRMTNNPYGEEGPQIRTQAQMPIPGRERQTVWSQALDPGRAPGAIPEVNPSKPQYFVQLEPSEAMTKAFTPHGLLSVGLQDKEGRSAKRQEEMARETGGSLINVPNKPPPPQTGLLGAVAAHERERTREGGLGAALTEREREKRMAEDRQRKFDDQQRQQMEQFGGMGSMYGGYNPMMGNPMMMGMNPMMSGMGMNPMMTGMNPMMTGGMYPGMMGGLGNQQAMMAAQQAAAQAYQQSMMSYAASQVGGSPGDNANAQSTMGGQFDPRMSMMQMPMMGMGGMNPMGMQMAGGAQPGMNPMGMPMTGGAQPNMSSMGMQMAGGAQPTMNPMGMQMTGGGQSTFDPRYSPGNEAPLQPPNGLGRGERTRSNSPSPLRSNLERLSRPTSPKP